MDVDEPAVRYRVGDRELRVVQHPRERSLKLGRLHRHEVAEQVRQAAPREPRPQQACEERDRHQRDRAGRAPEQDRVALATHDQVDGEQRRPQQQAHRPGDARQHRPPPGRRRRAPAHGDDARRADGECEIEPPLHAVDHRGDLRVGNREQEGGRIVGEDQPERREHDDLDDHGPEQHPVRRGSEPAARAVGEHQGDEEQGPQVGQPARDRRRKQRVVVAEQRRQEEREAGGRHQQTAAAVGAPSPGDQTACREGTPDQAQDHVDGVDRRAAEHDRREHGDLGHDGGGPQREPDATLVDQRGEAVDQRGAGPAARPRNRVARHRPSPSVARGRRPAVGPAAGRL